MTSTRQLKIPKSSQKPITFPPLPLSCFPPSTPLPLCPSAPLPLCPSAPIPLFPSPPPPSSALPFFPSPPLLLSSSPPLPLCPYPPLPLSPYSPLLLSPSPPLPPPPQTKANARKVCFETLPWSTCVIDSTDNIEIPIFETAACYFVFLIILFFFPFGIKSSYSGDV